MDNEEITDSDLLLPQITKDLKRFGDFTKDQPIQFILD
jgi:hypothetical protein